MKKTPEELVKLANNLFERQYPLLSMWQSLADHFYPERADFTITRNVGSELADPLATSYPVLVRRDLANSFAAMLRDGEWFKLGVEGGGTADHMARMWLDWSTKRLRGFMESRKANFVRATKEGDHDYATFGNCVLSVELNKMRDGLLYRCWHLRDCAWFDDEAGHVGGVARKWKPLLHELFSVFGDKIHKDDINRVHKEPFSECDIRHMVIPSSMYGDERFERFEFVSLFVDVKHNHLIEEVGMDHMMYVIPRFQTISGSPYAYSPATVVGLPDARSIQAMTHTLLEAAERHARPPIVATSTVTRSDVDLSPDGITWVDADYDEKMGAALRPLMQNQGGFPIGMEMRNGIMEVMQSAFYLNKISLPPTTHEMTAYEVAERMKQYRRENLPLFAPIESEYNGQLCEASFNLAMKAGLLGSPYDIPESLKGANIKFEFKSPLTASQEEQKANRFSQVSNLLAQAAEYDQAVLQNVDFDAALRDAIEGTGAPQKWLRSLEEVVEGREQLKAQEAAAGAAQMTNSLAEAQMNAEVLGG